MSDKLLQVHPELKEKIIRILNAMYALGFPMIVFEAVRTPERQHYLYEQGRSRPGKIVTNCDGYTIVGPHQLRPDGFGHAVDCVFLENGQPSWNAKFPWKLYGEAVKSQNLIWGGDWVKLRDFPHAELK